MECEAVDKGGLLQFILGTGRFLGVDLLRWCLQDTNTSQMGCCSVGIIILSHLNGPPTKQNWYSIHT